MATDVFISYSRKDKVITQKLFAGLIERGRKSWVDWKDIELSVDWWEKIKAGIESADTFLFILSNNSLDSAICQLEVAHAIEHNKRIIPVSLSENLDFLASIGIMAKESIDAAMQDRLFDRDLVLIARDNWKILSQLNWIFLQNTDDFENQVDGLVETLDTDRDYVRQHTNLLEKALQWQLSNYSQSYLLRGEQLVTAELWLTENVVKVPKPTSLQIQFLTASREAVNKELEQKIQLQRRATNRTRYLLGTVVLFFIVVTILGTLTWLNTQSAINARNESSSVNIAANALLESDVRQSELTALLSIQSLRTDYSVQAETLLYRSLRNISTSQLFDDHEQLVRIADFTQDGSGIITGSYDEYLRRYNLTTGTLVWDTQFEDAVMTFDQTSDGRYIVVGIFTGQVFMVDSLSGEIMTEFQTDNNNRLSSITTAVDIADDDSKVLVATRGLFGIRAKR